jgi:hypothetical protein
VGTSGLTPENAEMQRLLGSLRNAGADSQKADAFMVRSMSSRDPVNRY